MNPAESSSDVNPAMNYPGNREVPPTMNQAVKPVAIPFVNPSQNPSENPCEHPAVSDSVNPVWNSDARLC